MSKIILKDHNKQSFENIIELFKIHNRVAVEQATGTGKSYVTASIIETGLFKNVLILAPSVYILDQFKDKFSFLNKSVNALDFLTYTKTMFLDDEEIREDFYDLIIVDEYHRLGAKKWGKSVNSIFNRCPNAKILGVTATPIRYFDNERNMTEEIFNGIVANRIGLDEAIQRNIISKPKYVMGFYSIKEDIDNINSKIENKKADDEKIQKNIKYITSNFDLLYGASSILKKYISDERKFIVFCENKKHLVEVIPIVSQWFKSAFNKDVGVYTMFSDNVHSNLEFEQFKNANKDKFNVLFVVNMMNEGIHVDGENKVDGLIMLRRTVSPNIYYQQLGRGITLYNEKPPIIFDLVNNSKNLNETYFAIPRNKDYIYVSSSRCKYDKVDYDLSNMFEVHDETVDILNVLEDIRLTISDWNNMYNQLVEYKKKHGNLNVPLSMRKLHKWKHKQILFYKEGRLKKSRYEKLKELGLSFDYLNEHWDKKFKELVEFKNKFGHTLVSKHIGDYCELGSWLDGQRKVFKKGTMKKERVELFNSIGVSFEDSLILNAKWEAKYSELVEYKNKFGTANVPSKDKKYSQLANFCKTQRVRYRQGKLERYRYEKLVAIGFIFDQEELLEANWNSFCDQVAKIKKETGDIKPKRSMENYNSISAWVYRQINLHKEGKLPKDKVDKLISIGFEF